MHVVATVFRDLLPLSPRNYCGRKRTRKLPINRSKREDENKVCHFRVLSFNSLSRGNVAAGAREASRRSKVRCGYNFTRNEFFFTALRSECRMKERDNNFFLYKFLFKETNVLKIILFFYLSPRTLLLKSRNSVSPIRVRLGLYHQVSLSADINLLLYLVYNRGHSHSR